MSFKNGGELAARALADQGVKLIYTLSGGHITPIYQFLENGPITLFDTRHEQAAVFMAEAHARLTREPGVAMVTAGPGFTNALTPIASARMALTPLVLISGAVGLESREKLDLQDMHQRAVIEPMVKRAFVCHKPERIAEYVDMAFRTATTGRPGPVYLELPVDVLNAPLGETEIRAPRTQVQSKPMDPAGVEALIDLLGQAERPVMVAGSGVWYSDGGNALTALAEKAGLPVFTVNSGRGTIPDGHPLCFESAVAIRPGAALFAHLSTDLVILVGTRVSLYYIFGDVFNPGAKMVQVDIEPEEIGRNRRVDLGIHADARALLEALSQRIGDRNLSATLKERFAPWVTVLQNQDQKGKAEAGAQWESDATPIHPMRLAREVDAFFDREDDIVVADGGDTTTWLGMTRTAKRAGRYLDYGLYGCLGAGLPNALAAKNLYPNQRVGLLSGDGSIGFNFMEFETALRKKLPFVAVVSNDLGWGMIRHSQEIRMGRAIETGTWLGRVDYHKIVEAMGGRGFFVERPQDIRPALEEAMASEQVCLINVMTDPTTVSPGSVALANLGAYKA